MANRSRFRLALAMTVALSAFAVPATASAFFENYNVGSTDSYEVFEPGVICKYENNPGFLDDELDRIKVNAVRNVHHPSSTLRKVGVRVIFHRNRPPHSDDVYSAYYRTPWMYKLADNNANPKTFGPWELMVPEDPIALWRVEVRIKYYAADGSTVIGQVRGWIEVYRHKAPDASADYEIGSDNGDGSNIGYCREEFH